MKTVAFTTLGCKVNQYDTDAMKSLFLQHEYTVVPFDELADIYVINTCSVTHVGEKKSRQLIRQAKRRNTDARVVVTGCYAQLAAETIQNIEGVNLIIGNNDRHKIVELVESLQTTTDQINAVRDIMSTSEFEELSILGTETNKTRAFMKIQEGCNNFCTFCIIPYTRGKLKSRKMDSILEEANRLVIQGFKEIVLTGIHLGNYGVELEGKPTLAHVIKNLLTIEGLERIRLGSMESVEVSPELIQLIRDNPRVCSHLHLPLQSGCDKILKAMNRHYTLSEFTSFIAFLRKEIPHLAITTDIIVGFPGETEEDFRQTMETVKECSFTHIHAFPYSKREGTPAATMADQVSENTKKERVAKLNALGDEGLIKFATSMIGTTESILIEQINNGICEGLTSSYIHGCIYDEEGQYEVGDIVTGKIVSLEGNKVLMRI